MTAFLIILGIVLLLLIVYIPLPHLYMRKISKKVLRHLDTKEKIIALTFDDGPDPLYTPKILDILDDYHAKATFFMLGNQIDAYPEIVREVLRRGHAIGLHSQSHHHAWFQPPWIVKREVLDCRSAVLEATGTIPHRYRPPWGGFNFYLMMLLTRIHFHPIFWDVEIQDWEKQSPDELTQKLLSRISPGSVVLLHDHNHANTDTPSALVKALPQALSGIAERGYRMISLDQWEDILVEKIDTEDRAADHRGH